MASADGETVLFKSVFTDKYVRPLVEYARPTELTKGRLSADGKGDPKMYLERASTGSGLYHIKSHETNKYWQLKSANNLWIVAQADAPNENNSWECTLFEIETSFQPRPQDDDMPHKIEQQQSLRSKVLPFCILPKAEETTPHPIYSAEYLKQNSPTRAGQINSEYLNSEPHNTPHTRMKS
ncbi:hypothetical protein LOK49_LG12G00698 [Camellia lanceoleosa]|uniref:Uncharacterized protein n=1 Tax=Camellia lanceoleosa TaxID=1840588 RepID=A0ACC0FUA4_9ERIC|nr:hypothetical protein LOK49_LG12G00698 [Camellia lanceoleosa]